MEQHEIESFLKDRKDLEDKSNLNTRTGYMMFVTTRNNFHAPVKWLVFFETSNCNLFSALKEMDRSLCNLELVSSNVSSGFADKLKKKDDEIAQA
ncbi:hypothetical protein Bca101_008046 [Brassica carinata]